MNTIRTIAGRELGSYFKSGAGWALIALFVFISGVIVWMTALSPGRAASLRTYFDLCGWLLLPIAPAVTMRLIAEEIRSGTIETLLTAPVSGAQLVLGKFIGALGFLLCAMIPTMVYVALLYRFASPAPDAGAIMAGYLSLVLLGIFMVALGTLTSALTSNATLAFMMCFFTLLAMLISGSLASSQWVPEQLRAPLYAMCIGPRLQDFAKGVADLRHIAFFLGSAAVCLTGATISVESRRMR
jgi:ABC-2 type transport system permease protein